MTNPDNDFAIRRATAGADAEALLELIIRLAEFEKLPPPDAEARERLFQDGFERQPPRFEAWLAEIGGKAVGYALLFETYSSFLCRPTLYLEDLFVLPDERGRGFGKALLRHCVGLARERGCGRMEWTCLDWNTKAQDFYAALGARRLDEWHLYRFTQEALEALDTEKSAVPRDCGTALGF